MSETTWFIFFFNLGAQSVASAPKKQTESTDITGDRAPGEQTARLLTDFRLIKQIYKSAVKIKLFFKNRDAFFPSKAVLAPALCEPLAPTILL